MKRLIKRAEPVNTTEIIENWYQDWESLRNNPGALDQIIAKNPDCVGNFNGYRYIELEKLPLGNYDKDSIREYCRNNITPITEFTSFSKSKEGLKYYLKQDHRSFGAIIYANIQGLDLVKLAEKYKENLSSNVISHINNEDEVITINTVSDYDIPGIVVDFRIK